MEQNLLDALKEMTGVVLQPGDVLAISPTLQTSKEQLTNIANAIGPALQKAGNYLIILPPGMKLEHVSKDDLKKMLPIINA